MDPKEILINQVIQDIDPLFNWEQIKKIKTILTLRLSNFEVHELKNDLVIYDERSDAAAYKQFIVSKKLQGLSSGTIELYMYTINKFIRTVRKPFKNVTTNDIRLYVANRELVDKVSNATISRERGCIVRFFHWLFEEEYIEHDVGCRVEKIKVEKRIKKEFSDIEIEKIRNAAANSKEILVIELLLSTGCRVSELVSLSLENYDRSNDRINVVGKGNKERYVYLNAKAKVSLMRYLAEKPHFSGPILLGKFEDRPMTKSGIQKMLKCIGVRAKVANVHPHRFRRTAATTALRHGMPIELVMQYLGHEQMDTTLRYAMISKDDLMLSHKKYVN